MDQPPNNNEQEDDDEGLPPILNAYFDYVLKKKKLLEGPEGKASEIVFDIIADLTDRRGISGAWDEIDHDIQGEIIETLIEKVKSKLN